MATKIDISNKRIRIFTRQASNIWATTNGDDIFDTRAHGK
jgi:hypothetical protein